MYWKGPPRPWAGTDYRATGSGVPLSRDFALWRLCIRHQLCGAHPCLRTPGVCHQREPRCPSCVESKSWDKTRVRPGPSAGGVWPWGPPRPLSHLDVKELSPARRACGPCLQPWLWPLWPPPPAPRLPQKQPEPSGLPGDGTRPSAGLPHSVRPVKLKGQRAPSGRMACPEVRGTGVAAHPPVPTEAHGADAEPARRGRAQRHVRCTDP